MAKGDWSEVKRGDTLYIEFHDKPPDRDTLDHAIEYYADRGFDRFRLLSGDEAGSLKTSAWTFIDSWDDFGDDMEDYAASTGGAFGMAFQ